MNGPDERDRRISELEERLARLSEASLRINESLDSDTVLQKVLDSARGLTGARYGVIGTRDEQGGLETVLTSGTSEDEHRRLIGLPGVGRVFARFFEIAEPMRVDNYSETASAVELDGVLPITVWAGMSAPIRHLGQSVGVIFLGHDRKDRKFDDEAEKILVMFSSQAAMVIANARRYRDERRARADLETLIDTSPVGVVVFDAATGVPKSFNREARRIVDSLRDPDQAAVDLLDVVTLRRADGREVSLRDFPMAGLLRAGETVRSEEIVMRVPDGRSVTVLLNATPIRSDAGLLESMVVTMQDMAAVEELERLRAEFLAMVSHELRAPLTSIKGSAASVLGSSADLDPAVMRQFFRIVEDQADQMNNLVSDLLDVARIETGSLAVSPEPSEVAALLNWARNSFVSAGGRDNLAVDIEPDLPLVLADRRRIAQVLRNLLSNAARNSEESSAIRVSAARQDVFVALSVSDEGRGIPSENLPLLFRKFSRTQLEDQGGDTGLGLAICKGIVEAHGGRIWAESDGPGLGARFSFTLPAHGAGAARALAPAAIGAPGQRPKAAAARARVLVVDDDPQSLRYVRDALIQSGYAPILTGDPGEALRLMREERPQLALLDLMLPGTDGIELMQDIVEIASVPVIFLSAYGRDEIIARAFEKGAVDYMVKPFSPTELTARIGSALRRREVAEPSEPYVRGDLTIDFAARRVTLAGVPVRLTALEYRLLAELAANAGRVLTYEQLWETVWRAKGGGDVSRMRTIAGKLRRKLREDARNPSYLFTESRVGYRMAKGEGQGEEPHAAG